MHSASSSYIYVFLSYSQCGIIQYIYIVFTVSLVYIMYLLHEVCTVHIPAVQHIKIIM